MSVLSNSIVECSNLNTQICLSCHREMNNCICNYSKHIEKNELFYNALFINNMKNTNHKVLRKIIDMFESSYGFKDFDPNGCSVDDVLIENKDDDNCYTVSIQNKQYNPNKSNSYNNEPISIVRIEYYNQRQLHYKVMDYVSENICHFNRNVIFNNLIEGIYKEVNEYENEDEYEDEEPEKVFENDSCPVCMEEYDMENVIKKIACCGHMCCNGCYTHIINLSNSRCPTCRKEWDNEETETEYIEWTYDDIEELCDEEDYRTLTDIINLQGLCDDVTYSDGYAHTLGYEECDFYDNTRFPNETDEELFVLVGEY